MKKITTKFLTCALSFGAALQVSAQEFQGGSVGGDFLEAERAGRGGPDKRLGFGRLEDVLDWIRDAKEEAYQGEFYRVERILERIESALDRYDRDYEIRRASSDVRELSRTLRYRRRDEFGLGSRVRQVLDEVAEKIRCSEAYRYERPGRPTPYPRPDPRPVPPRYPRGEIREILCESFERTPRETNRCEVGGRILSVVSVQQVSRDICIEGRSFHIQGSQIVVNRGCRAWFKVEIEDRGGGRGPFPDHGGGRGPGHGGGHDPGHGGGRGPRN